MRARRRIAKGLNLLRAPLTAQGMPLSHFRARTERKTPGGLIPPGVSKSLSAISRSRQEVLVDTSGHRDHVLIFDCAARTETIAGRCHSRDLGLGHERITRQRR